MEKKFTVEELVANERFQNYCRNTSDQDVTHWEEVIFSNWDQRSTFEEAFKIVASLSDDRIFNDADLKATIVRLNPTPTKKVNFIRWIGAVASIMVLTLMFFHLSGEDSAREILITQISEQGTTKEVILPDGSSVTLHGESSITYHADMDEDRKVSFTGEAFFDVETKDDRSLFSISGEYGEIVVTGTKFNLKNKGGLFEATLIEGSIYFHRPGIKPIVLSPSDQLIFYNNRVEVKRVDVDLTVDWVAGRMFYKDIMIKDLLHELNQDYGLLVNVKNDRLNKKIITANMLTTDPLVLLRSLALIYEFEIVESDNSIILK